MNKQYNRYNYNCRIEGASVYEFAEQYGNFGGIHALLAHDGIALLLTPTKEIISIYFR